MTLEANLKDVTYGPYERNKLDLYQTAHGEGAAPVVIFFHGGGYVHGDKTLFAENPLLQDLLDAGISVVSSNYRFITEYSYPAPMEDGTRAIQFVRSMAKEWKLDENRIVTMGSSAGGHLALWNALKGDLSRPESEDGIERFSSAVCGFVGFGTQASKDQRFYEGIYEGPHIQPRLAMFYGLESDEELYLPENLATAYEASAINHLTASAPPAFLTYAYSLDGPRIPADAEVGEVIHHPAHGYALQQKYKSFGIPCELRHKDDPPKEGEIVSFVKGVLEKCNKEVAF
ncbi:alpha/beta hydrolase [Paenibacillus sp. HB172176]|uniref:alpha/beta hydrolase n=1 Tax=Paenibacillus sp. HB172176 TaxID=2493690 RepID=UPI00143993F1|nr:alpha/beta hydrolase [Paenibacillus sp. HB172176]